MALHNHAIRYSPIRPRIDPIGVVIVPPEIIDGGDGDPIPESGNIDDRRCGVGIVRHRARNRILILRLVEHGVFVAPHEIVGQHGVKDRGVICGQCFHEYSDELHVVSHFVYLSARFAQLAGMSRVTLERVWLPFPND